MPQKTRPQVHTSALDYPWLSYLHIVFGMDSHGHGCQNIYQPYYVLLLLHIITIIIFIIYYIAIMLIVYLHI